MTRNDVAWLIWCFDAMLVPVLLVSLVWMIWHILLELRYARYRHEQGVHYSDPGPKV